MASQPLTTKNELRGLTLRIARVVAMMNRYGYRVTPQSGAMLQVRVRACSCVWICVGIGCACGLGVDMVD